MNFKQSIEFASLLLSKLHIDAHVIEAPEKNLSSKIDRGLRAMLFGEKDYSKLLISSPLEAEARVIYRFFDEYLCHYIFFRIPEIHTNSFFFAGPYLPSFPSEEFLEKKSGALSLSETKEKEFRNYYRNLPIVEDENVLMGIMDTLGCFVFGSENDFSFEYVSYEIPDRRRPVYVSELFEEAESTQPTLSLEIIEKNYENEKHLIDAVRKGKLNQVDMITSAILNCGTENRLQDSLRNRKNYLIIFNTLLRKAAEYGEVHPFHIDRLSSSFAGKIEELSSIEGSLSLQKEMLRKYCLLVKEHSLKKYSQLIGRVITLIAYDLRADLSLHAISARMNVNASYLSAAFKKECGETLTDYVRRRRCETAAVLLVRSNKSVGTVAEECGILDVNYFIKIFKKQYGMTPTQYRANNGT